MYALFDCAETIELFGLDALAPKSGRPFHPMRGVKFNLPFEPYDTGDPFEKNVETCMSIAFWRDYIDRLALNRYNCLSLWSEHPFHMMFRLVKYPETCPYGDTELQRYMDVYAFIFRHARDRGIQTYLITWNIRIMPGVARGLGLPEQLGDMNDQYDIVHDDSNRLPNTIRTAYQSIQHQNIIKDYFIECLKTLLLTYRDLTGIGTTASEEMVGDIHVRHTWVAEVYAEAVRQSGRTVPFIHRTNCGNAAVTKQVFFDIYPGTEKYISWKYSNAHMYSHPLPQFEKLWKAWDNIAIGTDIKAIYTVRNDDIHTLRWGDPSYIRAYMHGMRKPYVHGYYWGADGYLWGRDFQHAPHSHATWTWDFEKHWFQFQLLGRLGYDPETPDAVWKATFARKLGAQWGPLFYDGQVAASRIIPAVNRLFWINYDFEWHPESLLSATGFKTILDFVNGKPMPAIGTLGIRDFAQMECDGTMTEDETPLDIIRILDESSAAVASAAVALRNSIPREYLGGEIVCTLLDLEAWQNLGRYYVNKFRAALDLARFDLSGKAEHKRAAIASLQEGVTAWKELARIGALHYLPYTLVRSKRMFGWSLWTDAVEQDIVLAEHYRDPPSSRPPEA
ncbi:MAG: hypothetical protein FJ222_08365 [Lentisphaerae bacterium]|nr:hypothetical protein [Lentisphaerota bacterium]